MSVRPSVWCRMHSVIFHPFELGKVPKDAEFSEVVHSTFRYRNFLIVYRDIAENRFPGNLNFWFLTPFMIVSAVKKVPDSEFLGFRTFGIIGRQEFTEYLPGNSGINYFFWFSEKSILIKVFEEDDSELNAFRFIRIMVFRITSKMPNLPGISASKYLFLLFVKYGFNRDFRSRWFRILRFYASSRLWFSGLPRKYRILPEYSGRNYLFFFSVKSISITVFEVADFGFLPYYGFRPYYGFPDNYW